MTNQELKQYMKKRKIYQWRVAERLGIQETALSRRFRHEIGERDKKNIIDELKNGDISIEELIKELELYSELNDGGTSVYKDKNGLFDKNIYVYKCHRIKSSRDNDYIEDYYISIDEKYTGICEKN